LHIPRVTLSVTHDNLQEKFRQQVGLSDLFEDKTYDSLAQKLSDGYFQLQVDMPTTSSIESAYSLNWFT
jgi:hypothetical protein